MENIVLLRIGFSLHVIVKICAVEYDEVGGADVLLDSLGKQSKRSPVLHRA